MRGMCCWCRVGRPAEEAAKVTLDYKAPVAAAIMVLMVAMMVFDFIPVAAVTAVMIAAVLMVVTGCVRSVEAAYKTINWETIVLFAAMMPMSTALEKTGTSEFISGALVEVIGGYGPLALLAGIYFTASLMTMFISNTVTALLMAPIALQSALQVPVCGDGGGEHVFRFALFYAAERAGDAGGAIYVHGLREGGAALADYHGGGDGVRVAAAVSVLKCGNNCLSFREILKGLWTDAGNKRICPVWWGLPATG